MNLAQLSKHVGKSFRLRPHPIRLVGQTGIPAPSDDAWRLDAILDTPSRLSLTNLHTGHILELGTDNVREFRTPDFLLLRCRLTVQQGSVEIEPHPWSNN
jgi:hypothetical protein